MAKYRFTIPHVWQHVLYQAGVEIDLTRQEAAALAGYVEKQNAEVRNSEFRIQNSELTKPEVPASDIVPPKPEIRTPSPGSKKRRW